MKRLTTVLVVGAAALVVAASASAHAEMSPPVAIAKHLQLFTLAVPTEKENAQTTKVELTLPQGFGIDSFVPSSGWKRAAQATGSGEDAVIQKVTWSNGDVPTEEDAVFQFLASPDAAKTYTFTVRQTYSDGSVVDWSGPESSNTPAPSVLAKTSLGGGGSPTLGIVALVLAAVALVVAIGGLAAGRSVRPLA
jgi:uncharacterized protein YcnI